MLVLVSDHITNASPSLLASEILMSKWTRQRNFDDLTKFWRERC